jgi:hypothetical protein
MTTHQKMKQKQINKQTTYVGQTRKACLPTKQIYLKAVRV